MYGDAAAAKAVMYSGIDLDFKMSTTTDGGWTLSTSGDIGGGQIADFRDDFELDNQEGSFGSATAGAATSARATSVGTPTIKISGNGIDIALKSNSIDSYYDAKGDNHDF